MTKTYVKPDVEVITFKSFEAIASEAGGGDFEPGYGSYEDP